MEQLTFSKRKDWDKGKFAFRIKLYTPQGGMAEVVIPRVNETDGTALMGLVNKLCAGESLDDSDAVALLERWVADRQFPSAATARRELLRMTEQLISERSDGA